MYVMGVFQLKTGGVARISNFFKGFIMMRLLNRSTNLFAREIGFFGGC